MDHLAQGYAPFPLLFHGLPDTGCNNLRNYLSLARGKLQDSSSGCFLFRLLPYDGRFLPGLDFWNTLSLGLPRSVKLQCRLWLFAADFVIPQA